MKKLMLLAAAMSLLLLTACGGLYGKAYLAEASGTVTLVRDGKESTFNVSQKGLKHQDTVKTAENSSARLRLDNGKEIVLDADTEVGLFDNGGSSLLELRSGGLLARLEKPLETAETFEIAVDSLSVSARDSTALFSVQRIEDAQVRLNVYQGKAAVVSNRNGGELTILSAGESILCDPVNATLTGQTGPIDYTALPETLRQYVADYAGQTETPAVQTPEVTEPEEDAPEEEEDAPAPNGTSPGPASSPAAPTESEGETETEITAVVLPEPEVTLPASPEAKLWYLWDRSTRAFQPALSVTWNDPRAAYIDWQLCSDSGAGEGEQGTIREERGAIQTEQEPLPITPPDGGVLWPQGYTVQLTPYYTAEESSQTPAALAPITLELPYLNVSTQRSQGEQVPVIATNIGFWFDHAVSALTVETGRRGRWQVTGELYPLEGQRQALYIDVEEQT